MRYDPKRSAEVESEEFASSYFALEETPMGDLDWHVSPRGQGLRRTWDDGGRTA